MVLRAVLPPPSHPFSMTATLRMPWSLARVPRGAEPVPAAADDHHVVAALRLGAAPHPLPAGAVADRVAQQGEDGEALHRRLQPALIHSERGPSAFAGDLPDDRVCVHGLAPCLQLRSVAGLASEVGGAGCRRA